MSVYFASSHGNYGRPIGEPEPESVEVVVLDGWDGVGPYEWGIVGSDEVLGDALDPAGFPPERLDRRDTDGADAVWVRPCAWSAAQVAA